MENDDHNAQEKKNEKKGSIRIPSYGDVLHGAPSSSSTSTTRTNTNNNDNPSFSQAFSFIKSSEFYSPPPPAETPVRSAAAEPEVSGLAASSSSSAAPASGLNRNAILVSHRQKGNPLLKHIRNVRWVFADVVCDYLLGQSSCALYLSLRYHLLHPEYLYFRIRELQKNFKLRVVLCHIDVEDVVKPLLEVTRTALLHDCTLLCGWSLEECGRYLETIKVYENKSADSIREQMDTDYLSRITHALTTVRRVNKTDVVTLGSVFGSLSRIMDASMEELARCPGIGERKVKRLYDAFHEPFRRVSSRPSLVPEGQSGEKEKGESNLTDGGDASKDNVESSKHKEPSVTVRSALTAAFAKYAHKVSEQDRKGRPQEQGEESAAASAANEDRETIEDLDRT